MNAIPADHFARAFINIFKKTDFGGVLKLIKLNESTVRRVIFHDIRTALECPCQSTSCKVLVKIGTHASLENGISGCPRCGLNKEKADGVVSKN